MDPFLNTDTTLVMPEIGGIFQGGDKMAAEITMIWATMLTGLHCTEALEGGYVGRTWTRSNKLSGVSPAGQE